MNIRAMSKFTIKIFKISEKKISISLGGITDRCNCSVVRLSVCMYVVCMYVVCHTRAPCWSRWTEWYAIRQGHSCGLVQHCGPGPPRRKGSFGAEPPVRNDAVWPLFDTCVNDLNPLKLIWYRYLLITAVLYAVILGDQLTREVDDETCWNIVL